MLLCPPHPGGCSSNTFKQPAKLEFDKNYRVSIMNVPSSSLPRLGAVIIMERHAKLKFGLKDLLSMSDVLRGSRPTTG